jgi:hypothetical protein
MKKVNAVILIFGLLVSTGARATEPMGDTSCGKWVKERALDNVKGQLSLTSWLIGYLNGIARWSEVDIISNVDRELLMVWMDSYCKSNPLESVEHGGFNLSIELIKKNNSDL